MTLLRPFIKICGVTSVEDAQWAVSVGASAIGLNLWEKSRRYVTLDAAARIAETVFGRVRIVAVTVDMPLEHLQRVDARLAPDFFQLHGNESDDTLSALAPRAFKAVGLASEADVALALARPGPFVLIDAKDPQLLGGTGKAVAAPLALAVSRARSTVLAGGLTPNNVAAAIEAVGPFGVDVASGVEFAPGKKDADAVRQFVEAAVAAFRRAEKV